MKLLPYNMASASAKALATELGCKEVKPDSTTFTNRRNHLIVNWGYSGAVNYTVPRYLNTPDAIAVASNKLSAFRLMQAANVQTPEWTTDRDVAQEWWSEGTVVLRHHLRGSSGSGIEIMTKEMYDVSPLDYRIPFAPLYVKYIKKQDEYRYHVFNDEVIDIQQKRKRREVDNDEVNYQVRSHDTGWVYCRSGVVTRPSLNSMAISAVRALGLDFGAVDIIWNEHNQRGYVLEVNTACGLEGETVKIYADAIRSYSEG